MSPVTAARSVFSAIWNDPSNEGERLKRLALGVAWQIYKRTVGLPLIVRLDNGLRFIAEPRAGNSSGVVYTRLYEARYTSWLRRNVVPGGTMCDVGANSGLFALQLADLFKAGVCFEPAPDTFQLLSENLRLNDLPAFRSVRVACSSSTGTARLVATGAFGCASGLEDTGVVGERTYEVPTVLLDDQVACYDDIMLVKIDTEGHDPEVLQGARATLGRSPHAVLMVESHPRTFRRLCTFLRDIDWPICGLDARGQLVRSPHELAAAENILSWGPEHPLRRAP
jgi:FkbM family methyltransferase